MVCRLLKAKYIVPAAHDAHGHPLFDAQSLHRTLGRIARVVGLVEPKTYRPGNDATRGNEQHALDSIVIDAEELARLYV